MRRKGLEKEKGEENLVLEEKELVLEEEKLVLEEKELLSGEEKLLSKLSCKLYSLLDIIVLSIKKASREAFKRISSLVSKLTNWAL